MSAARGGIIGVQVYAPEAAAIVRGIERAEALGVPAVWLTTAGAGPDGLTVFAAAAARTSRILLGTAITPLFTRHPAVIATQAMVVASVAPGRFRLGVGSSGPGIERLYGIPYRRPLAQVRVAVKILKGILQDGASDVDEAGLAAHVRLPGPPPGIPVYVAALRRRAFAQAATVADGAITWVCPPAYVREVALPAMAAAAKRAGHPTPPLVMHVPTCLSQDAAAFRQAARERLGIYPRLPHYQAMFKDAGFPEAAKGEWSDAMLDAVVVSGTETAVADRLRSLLEMGVAELLVTPIGAAPDPAGAIDATLRLVGRLAAATA